MYQHPQALSLNAEYYQHEALRDAEARRLAHQGLTESDDRRVGPSPFQRRVVALAVAIVTLLGVVALI
ncbi:MAG TPA: hypothetical protein VJK49_05900 [Candidatus Limnocylindrales bacterium]|nr:hypothetical protein [Candidatus Limnocylindrales bacterium]